jgi:hypothetical protein
MQVRERRDASLGAELVLDLREARRSAAVCAALQQARGHPDPVPRLGVDLDRGWEPPIAVGTEHHQLFRRHVRPGWVGSRP